MLIVLLIIPFLTLLSAALLDRYKGKKEVLRFDFVQFVYSFVLAPIFFVWLKSFVYYLAQNELQLQLSNTELFIVDTTFSVILFFVYAFVVIHSLTKSFEIKQTTDPLYDLFAHSEFFHQEFSHFASYFGIMLVFSLLSTVNATFPFIIDQQKTLLYAINGLGLFAGVFAYYGIGLFETSSVKFHKLMKLGYGLFFTWHVVVYFLFDIRYHLAYAFYWFVFMIFSALVTDAFFISFEKYPVKLIDKFFDQSDLIIRAIKRKLFK